MTLDDLPEGRYSLVARLAKHFPAEGTFRIVGGRTVDLSLSLLPSTGTVNVRTIPKGATTLLDDEERGKAPLVLKDVPVGPHNVLVKLDRYFDATGAVEVKGGKAHDLLLRLTPAANLTIQSKPGRATVTIGETGGSDTTPMWARRVPARKTYVELQVERTYYKYAWSGQLRVGHNLDNRYSIKLHTVNKFGISASMWKEIGRVCDNSFKEGGPFGLVVSPIMLSLGVVGSVFTLPTDAYVMISHSKPGVVKSESVPRGR